tara:strand:- start:227 stop:1258 length:1032 start_codon:yes stop_codon:yes gene_type:complete
MQRFFSSLCELDLFTHSLDSLTFDFSCQHCSRNDQWVSHGYVCKQSGEKVGKRILCARRYGKQGCGRTRQLYLQDIIPQRRYTLSKLLAFIAALIKGLTVEQAYYHAAGHDHGSHRQAWRWLNALWAQTDEHIEHFDSTRECTVVSCSRTLHTYRQIAWQLADAFKLDSTDKTIEKDLIHAAFEQVKARKTLYILIDEAHLLDIGVLRKLRLLFERFPKNHNLVLFGQPELLHALSLSANQDIKSRITYSANLKPLNDEDMEAYIVRELEAVKMGINTFDEAAMTLIIRSAEGNLRLCRNLCLASLIEAARETKKTVTISHVNNVLVQPHWRSHDQLIKQQVA